MILILTNETDESTNHVIDWLISLGQYPVRINGEDLLNGVSDMVIDRSTGEISFTLNNSLNSTKVRSSQITSVWYRRWANYSRLKTDERPSNIVHQLVRYTQVQYNVFSTTFFQSLAHCRWLNKPADLVASKLQVLNRARKVGLQIPATVICTTKAALLAFKSKYKRIIAKSIGDVSFFHDREKTYGIYTHEVTASDIKKIDDNFFPTLIQERIEKKYELRIFYLDGKCYSMAIFSQKNKRTTVDYRKYDKQLPNRRVPYKLPAEVQKKIVRLMKSLNTNCGSIDLIRDLTGTYIFLEVNPVGQFGMTSVPCNYYLEKIIAKKLIKMSI